MKLIIGLVLFIAWFWFGEKIGQRVASDEYQSRRDVNILADESRKASRRRANGRPLRYAAFFEKGGKQHA